MFASSLKPPRPNPGATRVRAPVRVSQGGADLGKVSMPLLKAAAAVRLYCVSKANHSNPSSSQAPGRKRPLRLAPEWGLGYCVHHQMVVCIRAAVIGVLCDAYWRCGISSCT